MQTSLLCTVCSVQKQARECNFCQLEDQTRSLRELFLITFKNSSANYCSVILVHLSEII